MPLEDLIPFLRLGLNDTDSSDYEYSDSELITALRVGIRAVESGWNLGFLVVDDGDGTYSIDPDPEEWLQMMYVLKTIILMKTFNTVYHWRLPTISITNDNEKDVIKKIQEIYNEIEYEHRYKEAEFVFTTWDDWVQRLNLIYGRVLQYYEGIE